MVLALLLLLMADVMAATPLPVRVAPSASRQERLRAAHSLLQESPLIDGHNDLPWNLRSYLHNKLRSFNLSLDLTSEEPWRSAINSHTDFPRLRKGQVAAQVWSVYVPCEAQYMNTVQLLLEQIDVIKRLIASSPRDTSLVTSSAELLEAVGCGRVGSVLGVEGGHALGSSMGVLRALYDLGVRTVTLTHKCHTPWAESSGSGHGIPANAPGLTQFGKEMTLEMNRLGMIIDLSHTSAHTARDVLRASLAPVVFSHSACRALCDTLTNLPDDVLSSLVDNGGVVMVSFDPALLTCGATSTIANVIEHINHVRSMAGVDHVGIGAGYDGINKTPGGLEDVSRYPELFAELLQDPSWSLQDLKKLAGLNFLRVLARVEQVRVGLAGEGPSEQIVPIHDIDARWPCRYKFASLDGTRS